MEQSLIPFNVGDGIGSSPALAAGLGGLIGSWFGNGFGFGGWGDRGAYGAGFGLGGVAANPLYNGTGAVALDNVTNQISDVKTTLLESNASQNQILTQGFSGINQAVYDTSASTQSTLCQGFSGLSAQVNANGNDTRLAMVGGFGDLEGAIARCCCETQKGLATGFGALALESCKNTGEVVNAITNDGRATRDMLTHNYISTLETQLCDAKSRIGSLENQKFTAEAIGAQSVVFDAKLANAVNTIIAQCA